VLGQPARVVGLVMGEWEERSPWPPLAERRGASGDAVTIYGAIGTMDIADIAADNGRSLAWVIGQSLAYVGTNAYISHWGAEVMVVVPTDTEVHLSYGRSQIERFSALVTLAALAVMALAALSASSRRLRRDKRG